MNREELKRLWFSLPPSTTVRKEIIVGKCDNPYWPGYGDVEIVSDGPDGYSSFKTHQENPLQYVKDRIEDSKGCDFRDLSKYKLIVK